MVYSSISCMAFCNCCLDGYGHLGHASPLPATAITHQQQQQQQQQQQCNNNNGLNGHDPTFGTGLSTPPGGAIESANNATRMSPTKADTAISSRSSLTLLQPISATATSYTLPSLAPYPTGE